MSATPFSLLFKLASRFLIKCICTDSPMLLQPKALTKQCGSWETLIYVPLSMGQTLREYTHNNSKEDLFKWASSTKIRHCTKPQLWNFFRLLVFMPYFHKKNFNYGKLITSWRHYKAASSGECLQSLWSIIIPQPLYFRVTWLPLLKILFSPFLNPDLLKLNTSLTYFIQSPFFPCKSSVRLCSFQTS